MDPRRSERISEAIREELDEIIAYELADPRIKAAGVAEVTVSPDARQARVRVILTGDAKTQKASIEALNSARGFLRRELAIRIDMFRVPDLHFEAALSPELGSRMDQLLKRVRRGRPRQEDSGQPDSVLSPSASADGPATPGDSQAEPDPQKNPAR
jgi:ribosome-binding factor A